MRVRRSFSALKMMLSNSFPRWLISITLIPQPFQLMRSFWASSSTSSGRMAGPAAKLKARFTAVPAAAACWLACTQTAARRGRACAFAERRAAFSPRLATRLVWAVANIVRKLDSRGGACSLGRSQALISFRLRLRLGVVLVGAGSCGRGGGVPPPPPPALEKPPSAPVLLAAGASASPPPIHAAASRPATPPPLLLLTTSAASLPRCRRRPPRPPPWPPRPPAPARS